MESYFVDDVKRLPKLSSDEALAACQFFSEKSKPILGMEMLFIFKVSNTFHKFKAKESPKDSPKRISKIQRNFHLLPRF